MIRIDLLKQKNNAKKIWSLVLKLVPLQPKKIFNYGLKRQIGIHRPHPGSIMKEWMVKTIYQHLKNNGFIK